MKRAAVLLLALGACSDQAIIEAAYPDGETFTFASRDGESVYAYRCARGATPAATKARAAQAHGYLDGRLSAAMTRTSKSMETAESGESRQAIGRALDTEVGDIVEQTDARYQCLFVEGRDA